MENDKRLALQAYEQIRDLILSGAALPGTMLTERRLAETLEMSRTPIRDALLMLEGEGLLMRQGTRGLQVRELRIEDFMDAVEIRLLLEPGAAALAAGRMSVEELASLKDQLGDLLKGATNQQEKPSRSLIIEVDERVHNGIADATGNRQLAQIIRTLRRQTQIFDLRRLPERLEATCREHLDIVQALQAADGDAAAKAMRTHLEQVRYSIINRLTKR